MLGGTHKSRSQGSGASLTERNHGTEGLKKVNSPGKTSPLSLPHGSWDLKPQKALGSLGHGCCPLDQKCFVSKMFQFILKQGFGFVVFFVGSPQSSSAGMCTLAFWKQNFIGSQAWGRAGRWEKLCFPLLAVQGADLSPFLC